MNKISSIAGSAMGAALLAFGTFGLAASAMAAGAPNMVHGTVVSVVGSTITVAGGKAESKDTISIVTSNSTKFWDVTRAGTSGTRSKTASSLANIQVGDTLNASGSLTSALSLSATEVLDVSGPAPIHGKVTEISGSTITLKTNKKSGSMVYTINTTSATQFFSVSKEVFGKRTKTEIDLGDVQVGNKISVHGIATSAGIVNATLVNDRG